MLLGMCLRLYLICWDLLYEYLDTNPAVRSLRQAWPEEGTIRLEGDERAPVPFTGVGEIDDELPISDEKEVVVAAQETTKCAELPTEEVSTTTTK